MMSLMTKLEVQRPHNIHFNTKILHLLLPTFPIKETQIPTLSKPPPPSRGFHPGGTSNTDIGFDGTYPCINDRIRKICKGAFKDRIGNLSEND
jgi:hypothetical protein